MKFSAVIAIAVIAVVASLAMVDATSVLPSVSDNHSMSGHEHID
jgi:hypothetical protein